MLCKRLKHLGLALATVAATTASGQGYDAVLMPTLQHEQSSATFVADDGTVLAYVWTFIGIPSLFHGYIYRDGVITTLQRLPQHADAIPISMNSSGVIVGYCKRGHESPGSAAIWDLNGNVRPLDLITRVLGNTYLSDINEAGHMAMNVEWFSPQYRAMHVANGVATYLFPSGPLNRALEINDLGVICGTRHSSPRRAFLWRRGQVTFLPGDDATAAGLNNGGLVVGVADQRPVYWENGVLHELPRGNFSYGYVSGVNEAGAMVGGLYEQGGPFAGAIWESGNLTIVEGLFPPNWGAFEARPNTINKSGQISGSVRLRNGLTRGFLLTPR